MKKSSQLLIALLTITFLAIVGTNMILKAEYDKIDFTDRFYGYSQEEVKPFKVIQLKGNSNALVHIQQGDSFQARIKNDFKEQINLEYRGDTLVLTSQLNRNPHQFDQGDPMTFPAEAYIVAPDLTMLSSENVRSRIDGWRNVDFVVRQEGSGGGIYLDNNTFKRFNAKVKEGSLLKVGTNNKIGEMNVELNRYGSFETERDVFESLNIQADSLSTVKLTGSLLKEFFQQK